MKFLWPQTFWLAIALPILVAAYVYGLRRRRAAAAQFAGLARAQPKSKLRFVPPILFLIALAAMLFAIARPVAVITLPSHHETVILAIDVSGSMRATDLKPSRLAAAQSAARSFIDEQPRSTRIGIVAFAESASVVQQPTHDRDATRAALERLKTQPGTALGSAIVVALGAIFPGQGITVDSVQNAAAARKAGVREARPIDGAKQASKGADAQGSAAIVVLTDGQANAGVPPAEAARAAAERNVRVFTIGTGTPTGETMTVDGMRMRVRLDEDTLKDIANITRGQYFYGGDTKELKQIYSTLNTRFLLQKRETEVTALAAAVAAVLAFVSAALSLLWFNRVL